MTHQPAISFSISFQHPFNRAGGRTSNVRHKILKTMIRVKYLKDCQDTIPTWTDCFWREWQSIYQATGRTQQDVQASIAERTNTDGLPLAVVAFVKDVAVGTGCLKTNDFTARPDLCPWVAGIYVIPDYRRRGVASIILQRLEQESVNLGYPCCFLWTASAELLYFKHGWEVVERVDYCDAPATIMTKTANKS